MITAAMSRDPRVPTLPHSLVSALALAPPDRGATGTAFLATLGGLGVLSAALVLTGPAMPEPPAEPGTAVDMLLIGGIAFVAIYNGLAFIPTRQVSYALYAFLGLGVALTYATYFDLGGDLLGLSPAVRYQVNYLATGASMALALAFTLAFLQVHARRPALGSIGSGASLGLLAFTVLVVPFLPLSVRETVLAIPGLALPLAILALGVDAWRSGFTAARWFLAAWSPLLLVVLGFALQSVFRVDLAVGGRALLVASLLEMLLLALALMDRLQLAVDAREKAHEFRVLELTDRLRDVERLGPYTLGAELGRGGMGVVYEAKHALLRRPTAIKLIHPDRAATQAVERFEREVRTTARLTHPNTVTVFDYGRTEDGILYYAMELLDGATLGQVVRSGGPLPPERVVAILRMVCGALAEAHDQGLIHRDIKPGNIMLCRQGGAVDVAKVVDFGLVKELGADPAHPDLSREAALAGTPLYLAPELTAQSPPYSIRSDLYALGAVAWFMLMGRALFRGGSVFEVLVRHLQVDPALDRADVPEALRALVLDLLAKEPEGRPKDARAVLRRLDGIRCEEEWTQARAAAWWAEHEATIRDPRPFAPQGSEETTLLAADASMRVSRSARTPTGPELLALGPTSEGRR
jgi:hypothetical protein